MTEEIDRHVLIDGETRITVLSLGAAVQDWQVAGRPVVLGYADPERYRDNPAAMGAICGRIINRISDARYRLDGRLWTLPANLGRHHLHGGPFGFSRRAWRIRERSDTHVVLALTSQHLDQGHPGALDVTVTMRLSGATLGYEMSARPDRPAFVNLGQHLYFNLAGVGLARSHRVRIAADRMMPTDKDGLVTGAIEPVAGTRFDFREARSLDDADPESLGYDLNYVLSNEAGPQAEMRAEGLRLRLWTDRPGLQLYTSNGLVQHGAPVPGGQHQAYGAICLEAQDFPDAPNRAGFGSIRVTPDAPYRQSTRIEIVRDPSPG